jgi:hypothetical protein
MRSGHPDCQPAEGVSRKAGGERQTSTPVVSLSNHEATSAASQPPFDKLRAVAHLTSGPRIFRESEIPG